MEREKIQVANLKCNGCATTIKRELLAIQGVHTIDVAVANDSIDITYYNVNRDVIINRLHALGYPEATEKNGLLLQLKSYASCMLGRVSSVV
jgi:copper chaperone